MIYYTCNTRRAHPNTGMGRQYVLEEYSIRELLHFSKLSVPQVQKKYKQVTPRKVVSGVASGHL